MIIVWSSSPIVSPQTPGTISLPPAATIPDLLSAIVAYWSAAGLTAAIAPLHTTAAPAAPAFPHIVLGMLDEHLPGLTSEDRPVECWFAVVAAGLEQAKSLGALLIAALDPNPNRPPLAWATGQETFNVRDDAIPERLARTGPSGNYIYRYHIHYRFWINGSP